MALVYVGDVGKNLSHATVLLTENFVQICPQASKLPMHMEANGYTNKLTSTIAYSFHCWGKKITYDVFTSVKFLLFLKEIFPECFMHHICSRRRCEQYAPGTTLTCRHAIVLNRLVVYVLVCWWWWCDRSFAHLIAPVATTTSSILSSSITG